jgi:hypothetical protein
MTATSEAVTASSADNVAFPGHDFPNLEIVHIAAHRDYLPDELVSHNHGHRDCPLCPRIPIPDVHIGAANGRLVHPYQNVIDARLRDWRFLQP